ncbi:nuclear transport factor 2 family protein [Nocardia sp. NPDC050710]|uniref:nuclear transport factor 2 family protein n=1 Tax=Nocardia sp. NPDC050710 TaxID=3157220 RepID=UPI0033CE251C
MTDNARDEAEITRLITRLGTALDEGRIDDLRSIFTADATATTPGGTAHGRDRVIAQAARNDEGFTWFQHSISDILVDLGDDRASVRANPVGVYGRDTAPALRVGGLYRFGAVRTPDGRRFDPLAVQPLWQIENSAA